ncbi:expressed conserved protein [Echinococcus multilocularis]|uniref:Expressed conserved protein n=1 Tax=Echinococcus multilocularis TaxID=6211 RepID=A0A068Y0Z4_ECHMU|nr:expressed conserved protein [Echinococcus multilocularis]
MAYWYARHKRVDLSIIPIRGCCCIDNRMGCFIAGITTLFANTDFIIKGGFPGLWRMPFWKVMFIAHIVLFSFTFCLVGAISWPSKYRIYNLKPIVLNFFIVIVLHTIVELGVSTYIYSWYGLAAWRLPYVIVNVMFYIIRFVLAIWFMVISYSYILELRQELYAPVDPEARPEIEPASVMPSLISSGILGPRGDPQSTFLQ